VPLPGNVTLITVTGTYMDFGGNPKVGKVLFSADGALVDPGAKVIITSGTVEAELHNGSFSIDLPATNDPDVSPTGFTYKVTEQFQDGGGRPPYNLSLPEGTPDPYDLSSVDLGTPPSGGGTTYATAAALLGEAGFRAAGDQAILDSKGQPLGITPLDAGQKVPVLYLPDQSGTYVPVAQKGAANGVATLNGASQIPTAQYDGAVVVLVAQKAAANGVATLDATTKIPLAQIPTDAAVMHLAGAETVTGVKTYQAGAGSALWAWRTTGDNNNRLQADTSGQLSWGPGNAVPDAFMLRVNVGLMRMIGGLESQRAAVTDTGFATNLTGDTFDRFRAYADGKHEWGSGAVARDTNLYRPSADFLKTDDKFEAANFPSGAWTAWTPTWTTSTGSNLPSLGNAVNNSSYTKIGRTVIAQLDITFGSTTNFGAAPTSGDNWRWGVPTASAGLQLCAGFIELHQTSAVRTIVRARFTTTAAVELEFNTPLQNATAVGGGIADSVTPWTWASGHALRGLIIYEAAS
jgi:hypothetical protein